MFGFGIAPTVQLVDRDLDSQAMNMTEKTSNVSLNVTAHGRVAVSFLPAVEAAFAHLVMACQMAGLDGIKKTLTILDEADVQPVKKNTDRSKRAAAL